VELAGEWLMTGGRRWLFARVRVKNVGASLVTPHQEGTGLRVRLLEGVGDTSTSPASWTKGRVYDVLREHSWIEPGETVSDDVLVRADTSDDVPVMLEARFVWSWPDSDHNVVVRARQILPPNAKIVPPDE
jgi:hypothetical protein